MALRPPGAQRLLGQSGQQSPAPPTLFQLASQNPDGYAEDDDI
jgi:hypothetical protein